MQNDFDKVLTTDELRGISDEKFETIIENIVSNNLDSENKSEQILENALFFGDNRTAKLPM